MTRGPRGLRRLSRLVNRAALRILRVPPSTFVVLKTRGRITGRPHRVLLPVYYRRHDELFLVSAYRRRSDWVRNLLADGRVWIEQGDGDVKGAVTPLPLAAFLEALNDPAGVLPGPTWLVPLTRIFVFAWARMGEVVRVELRE